MPRATLTMPRALRAAVVICSFASNVAFAADCTLEKLAEVPVTMVGPSPTTPARINGTEVQLLIDSGAFWSHLSAATATELKLPLESAPLGINEVQGVTGPAHVSVTTVNLVLYNVPFRNTQFFVGGTEVDGVAGTLGENLLRMGDVEYDFAHGIMRLIRPPKSCAHQGLAYWVDKAQPYSVLDIERTTAEEPAVIGTGFLNGTRIRVLFDTGAEHSVVTRRAAERAGVRVGDPGVSESASVGGVGRRRMRSWVASFTSFKLGQEEMKNSRLGIGDLDLTDAEMLLGIDFFLSHRVYVATSQGKIYFTYNGGSVFSPRQPSGQTASQVLPQDNGNKPTDAAGFERRGAASLARRDVAQAVADLTRATEMSPTAPDYFYELGLAHREARQSAAALEDFNRALALKSDHVPSLVARAELNLDNNQTAAAVADLDTIAGHLTKAAAIRRTLGQLYARAELPTQAIAQYDLYLASHAEDAKAPLALHERCRVRAMLGIDLPQALRDCNAALQRQPRTVAILDDRALVELRLGQPREAIADWDAVLAVDPKNAWARYARGVAKQETGRSTAGQADIAAATALSAEVSELARKRGLVSPADAKTDRAP